MSPQSRTPQNVKTWTPLTEEQRDELRRLRENWVPPTKDERYSNARLAKRVRGLYSDEQKALHFVADAQTMERGVCSQSIKKHAADYGNSTRSLKRGFRGRNRDGKLEYPGLLARGIVFVVGGYPQGGRAPGGKGLTPDYAINREMMVRYIPDFDDSPEDDDSKGDPSSKKGDPLDDLCHISSLSSSLLTDSGAKSADGGSTPSAWGIPICPTGRSTQDRSPATDSDIAPPSAVSSKSRAAQPKPPTAVTCKQVTPAVAVSDETAGGLRLQAEVSRIAKTKLGNHRHIPKNLTGKFELLAVAGKDVTRDFAKWCDENPAAKRKMRYPIHEYVKVVDSRLGGYAAEDSRMADWVTELTALAYELTNLPTPKRQITAALKEFPIEAIKRALTYYVQNLPEDPTSQLMTSFWKITSIDAVLKAEHKRREATEGGEDVRKVKPIQHDLQALKRQVGILPFSHRIHLSSDGYSPCPFHNGDGERSFHVVQKEDGAFIGTCFSTCSKSFDAIAFVEKFDKVSTGESIRILGSLEGDIRNGAPSVGPLPKPKPSPMTTELWAQKGRAVNDADVATLAASRPNSKTPSAATLNTLGFKIGAWGHIIAPYRLGDTFYTIKTRDRVTKAFLQENAISQKGLFNIDAVTTGCDVYVVESELDAAVLHEMGYTAVSVINANQKSIEPEVLKKLLTAQRIFLVGDSDEAGKACMDNIALLLPPEKVYRMPPPEGVKDVGEWAMADHFQEQFESAISTTPLMGVQSSVSFG